MPRLHRSEELGHDLSGINSSWLPVAAILLSEKVPAAHQALNPLFISQNTTNLAYLLLGLQALPEASAAKRHHQLGNKN